jgi:mono/diheme cytochrome c family protein
LNHPWIGIGLALFALAFVIAPGAAPLVAQEREALVARGRALFIEKGCHACHRVGATGTPVGPDLSRVGAKYPEGNLTRWLSPSAEEPTQGKRVGDLGRAGGDAGNLLRHMPTPRLSETEARALAAYLTSLQ